MSRQIDQRYRDILLSDARTPPADLAYRVALASSIADLWGRPAEDILDKYILPSSYSYDWNEKLLEELEELAYLCPADLQPRKLALVVKRLADVTHEYRDR